MARVTTIGPKTADRGGLESGRPTSADAARPTAKVIGGGEGETDQVYIDEGNSVPVHQGSRHGKGFQGTGCVESHRG